MRFLIALLALLPVGAAEHAAYDSNGRIISLHNDAEDLETGSQVVAVLPSGKRVPLQVRRENLGASRSGPLAWTQPFTLPDGGRGRIAVRADETASVRYSVAVTAESGLEVEAIEFVMDLPRPAFLNGTVNGTAMGVVRPATGPVLLSGETTSLQFTGPAAGLDVGFDRATVASVVDRWDQQGRSFQLRANVAKGPMANGATATLTTTLAYTNRAAAPGPVRLTLDPTPRYSFDGFGGNFCWNTASPVTKYLIENLKPAWARFEMKTQAWDRSRENPSEDIRSDMETMRRIQAMGVPYVISVWWLPERLYTDPYEKPRSTHFRLIHPDRWNDLLDLLGSYLLYAKNEYGVEPDLFSFNESNIGVYVGQTPEAHTEALQRIGAHFRKLGLKTRMLLGDATGPRDTHKFVLDAAAHPEALQYVGAIAFHSWGGGTPEQYAAWGDAAQWLGLPLLVTELGVDAAAYNGRAYDSYHYGLREARMTLELIQYARPQGTQFWQFTNDYALARLNEGKVEPTPRFWLMKHFTDLTPQRSQVLGVSSDTATVLSAAFRKDNRYTIHILNTGAARTATVDGLPAGAWRVTETTEATQFVQRDLNQEPLALPAHSLVTLTLESKQ